MVEKDTKVQTIYNKGKVVFHMYSFKNGTFVIQTNKNYKMHIGMDSRQVHIRPIKK